MISLSDCLTKIVAKLKNISEQLASDIQQEKGKALLVFVIMGVVFWLVDNKLAAMLLMSSVPIVAFHWDARVYFVLALVFLVWVPFLLIAKEEYWAEQLAIYTYYLLSLGVVVELINYVRASPPKGLSLKEQTVSWVRVHINTSILIVVISLGLIGFYYLNDKFTGQLAEQKELLMRLGGYQVVEEDKEIEKMKQQLQEVITLLEDSAYKQAEQSEDVGTGNSASVESAILPSAITVEILNGGHERGAARKLSEALKLVGFNVAGVGNAAGDFTTSSIRYKAGDERKAEMVAKALAGTAYVWELNEETGVSSDVLVIIGNLKMDDGNG